MQEENQTFQVPQIQPELISLYKWTIKQDEKSFTFTCHIPPILNPKAITVFVDINNSLVRCSIPGDHNPFFAGHLYKEISSYQQTFLENGTILQLIFLKKSPEIWDLYINDFGESPIDMDPFSAFLLGNSLLNQSYQQNQDSTQDELAQTGMQLIQFAVIACFPPALSLMAQLGIANQKLDDALKLLSVGADVYNDSQCQHLYGMLLYQSGQNFEAAELNFRKAVENGLKDSLIALGELYSPLYSPHNRFEDAKKGFETLEKAYLETQNPYSAAHLAEHYSIGVGCPQDLEKMKKYLAIVKVEDPTFQIRPKSELLNELEQSEKVKSSEKKVSKDSKTTKIIAGAGTALLVGAAGVLLYCLAKKRQ